MSYLSLEEIRGYRGIADTKDDALLEDLIQSAQTEIDNECGRSFEGSTGTRYYRSDDLVNLQGVGGSGNVLYLGKDLLALGGLTNGDGTTIASTDCWIEPRNEPPYQWIRLKTAESWVFGTDGEITVSGTWGFSTSPPAPIQQAMKELVSYLYHLRDAATYDVVASPETGTITVPKGVPAHVKRILERGRYIRRRGIW